MHRRQSGNANLIIIIVLVVLVVSGAGLFVWSRQDKKTANTDESTATTSLGTPAIADKDEKIAESILEVEIMLQRPGDEELLPAVTPATFVEYMNVKLNDFDCDFGEFPEGGYSVTKISPRFIAGGLGCGGGASIVWYLTTAGWEELGFQAQVPCSRIVELAIPSEFMSECYDDASPGEEVIANPNGPLN